MESMRCACRIAWRLLPAGGNGIGRAYALGARGRGARVLVADLDGDAAAETARQIEAAGGEALGMRTDVADVEARRRWRGPRRIAGGESTSS